MPCYSITCRPCGTRGVIYRKIAERDNLPVCDECGELVTRVIDKPMVSVFPEHESPLDGRRIASESQRADDLLRAGAYGWEPGMDKDIARRKQENIEASNNEIGAVVDDIVRDLNVCGKLENLNA
jgi:NAD-dependent SIR2 family protein deacetylase